MPDGSQIRSAAPTNLSVAPSLRAPVEAAPELPAHFKGRLDFIRMMAAHAEYSQDGRLLGWRASNGNFNYATSDDVILARGGVPKSYRSGGEASAVAEERRRAAAEAFVPGLRELVSRKTGRAF